jgi:hypothetical protein
METMTRRGLYTLVWSEPIVKVAPRFKLSDRGMGKLCGRYDIPVPPRGYWARKAAGKRVVPQPLPSGKENVSITFDGPKQHAPAAMEPEALTPEIEFERDPVKLRRRGTERSTHLSASASSRSHVTRPEARLQRNPPLKDWLSRCACRARLVKPLRFASCRRSLAHSSTAALSRRQGARPTQRYSAKPSRYSRVKQGMQDLTPDELRRRRDGFTVDPYELRPAGELSLNIRQCLPDQLHFGQHEPTARRPSQPFYRGACDGALRQKAFRADREREELKRQEAERRRKEQLKQQYKVEARIEQFNTLVASWAAHARTPRIPCRSSPGYRFSRCRLRGRTVA